MLTQGMRKRNKSFSTAAHPTSLLMLLQASSFVSLLVFQQTLSVNLSHVFSTVTQSTYWGLGTYYGPSGSTANKWRCLITPTQTALCSFPGGQSAKSVPNHSSGIVIIPKHFTKGIYYYWLTMAYLYGSRSITLHHRMREDTNPSSGQIKDFDLRIKLALEKGKELPPKEVKE